MIETLKPAQEKLQKKIRDKWISNFFSGKKINKPRAKKWLEWLYSEAKLKKPMILFFESPLGIQYAANLIEKVNGSSDSVWASVRDSVGDSVGASVRASVWASVGDSVRASVGDSVWASVRDSVRDSVGDSVRASVGDSVRASVRDSVGDSVWASVWASVKEKNLKLFDWGWCGLAWDSAWLSFYDYFQKIGIKYTDKRFKEYVRIFDTNIYDTILLDGLVLVASLPSKTHRNKEGRLHNPSGPAIEWKDGYKLWYLNGVNVEAELIAKLPSMSAEEVLAIENSEVRRVVWEVMDKGKIAELSKFKVLDEVKDDGYGNPMRVVEFSHSVFKKAVRMLNVFCASTKREYYLWTEKDKCLEAKSASFGLDVGFNGFDAEY